MEDSLKYQHGNLRPFWTTGKQALPTYRVIERYM